MVDEATKTKGSESRGHCLLIYPRTGIDVAGVSVFAPLSVMRPAQALRAAGFDVDWIDQRLDRQWPRRLTALLGNKPLFVGISAMTGKQLHWGLRAAAKVREDSPETPIIWGGVHAGILPEQTLADPLVDAVVAGPGEVQIVKLATALAAGHQSEVMGRIHRAPLSDAVPPASRFFFPAGFRDRYVTPVVGDRCGLAMVTSRGCPHQCRYCYNQAVHGSQWVYESAEFVLDRLAALADLGVNGVICFDDNFFVKRRRVAAIAEGILSLGLDLAIKADCRADYLVDYDDDFLALIKRAGFHLLYIGGESGSDRMLEAMKKGVDTQTLLAANSKLAGHGIRPHYSFMAGLPGETIEDMKATVHLMIRLKKEHPGAYLSPIKAYVPYPGTELFAAAAAAGFTPPQTLAAWGEFDWNFRQAPWLTAGQTRFVDKIAYLSMGLDPSVVELSGAKQSPFAGCGFRQFSRLCYARCRKPDFGLVPELPLIRLAKKWFTR